MTDNSPVRIYVNKTENRVTFETKRQYYLKILTPETMELLGSTKSKIDKNKNGESIPQLEIAKVVWVRCNVVNNDYQCDSRVLYRLAPNKSFDQLLDISPIIFIFSKNFNSEISYIEV